MRKYISKFINVGKTTLQGLMVEKNLGLGKREALATGGNLIMIISIASKIAFFRLTDSIEPSTLPASLPQSFSLMVPVMCRKLQMHARCDNDVDDNDDDD